MRISKNKKNTKKQLDEKKVEKQPESQVVELTEEEINEVSGGGCCQCYCPPRPARGGWG